MNDRDLLEAAAKAAGIDIKCFVDQVTDYDSPHYGIHAIQRGNTWETWNPLENDGDALRLAVALRIDFTASLENEHGERLAIAMQCIDDLIEAEEIAIDDPYAATRRAIVCAAAMIGSKP
jgi:hypothetical protein